MKKVKNQWRDPRNTWSVTTDPANGIITAAKGTYYHNDVEMAYTLLRQKPGRRSVYRGHIEVISQSTGKILVSGDGKKVRTELNCQDLSESKLKDYIAASAEQLYGKSTAAIDADYQTANSIPITPDSITPMQAFHRYASSFLRQRFPRAAAKKTAERLSQLKRFYSGLENVPMCKYSAKQIQGYIKHNHNAFGREAMKLSGDFWEHCLDKLYAIGSNPFPAFAEIRCTLAALQSKTLRAKSLSDETFGTLFDLLAKNASGKDCGVALMASGFTAEQVCSFRWRSLNFDPSREDFAQVVLLLPERAGAQHNYTRPCIPQTALILHALHASLAAKGLKTLSNQLVVSAGKKRVTPGELSKYAASMLVKAGVDNDTVQAARKEVPTESYARVLLRNTYQKLLFTRCGLDPKTQGGTIKFLCGLSLAGDVTSSNYTSFTSPEAQERLYTILKVLQPEKPIEPKEPTVAEDGSITFHITPRTTAETAGVVASFTVPSGWTLEVSCPHGVSGSTRTDPGNGSKRRSK